MNANRRTPVAATGDGRTYRFGPAAILERMGVLSALPTAMARLGGAMSLARAVAERQPAPVAPTPADVIGVIGAARLLRYRPLADTAVQAPILLCPSLINRLYVLDLKDGVSLVEVLRRAGHPVYGIDWGEPGSTEVGVGLDGFTTRLRSFVDQAHADAVERGSVAPTQGIHLLGHCLGGTLATILAATDPARIASLINLTAPLGFHDDGLLSQWSRSRFFDPENVVRAFGHVPPWLTQPAFMVLKPMAQPTKALRLFQALDKPQFLEMFRCLETWINDNVAIPDAFFVDLIRELYQRDGLLQGTLRVNGKDVALENIELPVLTVAAAHDHIVPIRSALEGTERLSSVVHREEVLPGGHIGVVVGGLARRSLWPLLLQWLSSPAAAAAQSMSGAAARTQTWQSAGGQHAHN